MSALYHFAKMSDEEMPDMVCYEKQSTWGGQWNPTWKIGTDEYGELVHSSIYPNLMINDAKEMMEYPDYTFQQHYGRALPSYVDAPCMREYLEGRFTKAVGKRDLRKFVKFSTAVRKIDYDKNTQRFSVTVHNLPEDRMYEETNFTHLVVATGIFSVPSFPEIPGSEKFKGRILHVHDFRQASEFANKTVLVVGSSYSAEDVAQLTQKYGAKRVIYTWRSNPMNFKWPAGIEGRPLIQKLDEHAAYFSDGSQADIDVIIFCTGYLKHYPFLPDELRATSKLSYYPDNLYKGILWVKGGDDRVFYLGNQDQFYSFTMFDVQALWACKVITGKIKIPEKATMLQDIEVWRKKLAATKDADEQIEFQTDYLLDLGQEADYDNKFKGTCEQFHDWERHKRDNISTYRDQPFKSLYSGVTAEPPEKPWMETF